MTSTTPKRKELKGIASGILSSFISRNNDVDGYWGIGKLYAHALQNKKSTVEIDLLTKTIVPPSDLFGDLIKNYLDLLQRQCKARNLPAGYLASARIKAQFNMSSPGGIDALKYWNLTYARGDYFECTLHLVDDLGKEYLARRLGRCSPHDPAQELRSTRAKE